jgi:hypothetical protein
MQVGEMHVKSYDFTQLISTTSPSENVPVALVSLKDDHYLISTCERPISTPILCSWWGKIYLTTANPLKSRCRHSDQNSGDLEQSNYFRRQNYTTVANKSKRLQYKIQCGVRAFRITCEASNRETAEKRELINIERHSGDG